MINIDITFVASLLAILSILTGAIMFIYRVASKYEKSTLDITHALGLLSQTVGHLAEEVGEMRGYKKEIEANRVNIEKNNAEIRLLKQSCSIRHKEK